MDQFRQKTINSLAWNTGSRMGRLLLMFLINIFLARLLSPREFGLVAMITVITAFVNIFAELCFSAALVQKKEITPVHLSSVFWFNLGIGILFTVLFMVGAPLIADFYHEPLLQPLTVFISLNFFISSLNIVQNTLLTKSLNFKTLSIIELSAVIVSGMISIGMAYFGFGVWSLVAQTLILSTITAILLWVLNDWRPEFVFQWHTVQELMSFSLSLFGTNLLNYWVRNIDYILIGRFLGSNPLGIYNRSYDVMLFPLASISRVFSKVMFPSLSIIQDDKVRVRHIYLKITRVIALITFPMMLGLFVTVEPFVLFVFGSQWAEMIPILQVLSLVGLTQSIGTLNGNLYLSQGKANLQFQVGFFLKAVIIISIVIGLQWGILGVAIAYALASLFNSFPNFYFAGGLVDLTYWQLLKNLSGVFICAVFMAIVVGLVGIFLPKTWSNGFLLCVQILTGGLVYLLLIHNFRLRAYEDLRQLANEYVPSRFKFIFESR